ncbi:MAG TPA: BON domain-containing protein, partial [Thermoanaerobaculia bacterium]|nr:BON domain-containing protein [Thermoanaerobaculia bacterium]
IPLAGCDRDIDAVHAEKDAQGKTTVHVDGEAVDKNFEQAEQAFDKAGEQIQEGAEQVGGAIQEGAERVQTEMAPVLDDAGVTAKVKARLMADPEVNAFHIDVDTIDGRVTLSGKVTNDEQKAEAEKLARRTEGVREVVNRLQVASSTVPAEAPVTQQPPGSGSQR